VAVGLGGLSLREDAKIVSISTKCLLLCGGLCSALVERGLAPNGGLEAQCYEHHIEAMKNAILVIHVIFGISLADYKAINGNAQKMHRRCSL
jgi:hypothetical protein